MNKQHVGAVLLVATLVAGCVGTRSDFREVIRETGDEVFPSLVYIRVVRDDLSDAYTAKVVGNAIAVNAFNEAVAVVFRNLLPVGVEEFRPSRRHACRPYRAEGSCDRCAEAV